MIASVIPVIVISICNFSHIVLAIFFFPSIVELLDNVHWEFSHRSMFIEYHDDSQTEWGVRKYNHSRHSILLDKADRYEKRRDRADVVNYYSETDKDFDEYLRFRENHKMLQQADDDGILIRKQNYRARINERMVEQPVEEKKKLVRLR